MTKTISLLICDVDGVLTDGKLYYSADGEALKAFHAHDGLGLKLLRQNGIQTAIISAKQSAALRFRLNELQIEHIYLGIEKKINAFNELLDKTKVNSSNVAYLGDDLPDLAPMRQAGMSIAVANAHSIIREQADWVTEKSGGFGAVREVCDTLLHQMGCTQKILSDYQ